MCYIEPLCSLIGSYKPHTDVLVKMSQALMVSLSSIVLNSRDWHEIYGFPCMKNQPYNNVSFKYWPFIHWYKAIGAINLLKQPKSPLQWKLSNFKNFVKCKQIVCLSAWLQQSTYNLNYWTYGLYSFPVRSLFPSTRTFVIFVAFPFIFCKSAFSCVFCIITTIEKCC